MKQFIQFIFCLFILVRLGQANLPSSNPPKTQEKQRFAIEPVDATARVGDTIILPCRVLNRVGHLQWTKDEFGLGLDRAPIGFPRYSMIGSDEEGDFSLEIRNVQLEDDGMYQCQVGASSPNVLGIRSRSSRLTVFIPPEQTQIKEGETLDTVENSKVTLHCESNAGRPAAEVLWYDENGHSINEGVEYNKVALSDGKRSNSSAKWQFIAGKQHHNKTYTCRAENSALEEPLKATILIRVSFAPKVKLAYSGDFQTTSEPSAVQEEDSPTELAIKESEDSTENIVAHVGENVTIVCDATANPSVGLVYKWYKDEQIYPGDYSDSTLNIPSINADFNGVKIGCEVLNRIGSSGVIYRQLSVSFAPKFSRPLAKTYTVMEGTNFKLACEVRSNPPADIVWHFEHTIVGRGKQLQLNNMDYSKAGRYSCVVSVKGFNEIQSSTFVQIKGAPRVISSPHQYGLEGEPIKLECIVQSMPKAATVFWRRNNQLIDVDNKNGYELVTQALPETDSMVRHLLVIRNAKPIDFGQYNCSATNELGEDSILITLTKQKTFPTLMIIASVIGATAAFLCVGVVVLLVMRRSTKTGDDFSANLKKQTTGTNSSMVLTNSSNANYNKALTDSGRSHMTVENASSAANSDLKLEIRTNSSLSDQEHHNPVINWEDEILMNNTLLTTNNMYNGQHVQAFETSTNNALNGMYDTQQYNQRFIITSNGVAPNYESIYNYPQNAQLVANGQLTNNSTMTLNMSQPINSVLNQNLINNNIVTAANKYSSPAKHQSQQSPPTYHNLASLSTNLANNISSNNINHLHNNLYLPSYTDYGQLTDYMQVQPNASQTDSVDNASTILGYTIASNGQPIITTQLPTKQCESAYSTLQTDARYRANYAARTSYSNQPISVNQTGLPSSPMYTNNQLASSQPNTMQVPNTNNNSSTLRNYITNSALVNSSLGSVNSQATLATHV